MRKITLEENNIKKQEQTKIYDFRNLVENFSIQHTSSTNNINNFESFAILNKKDNFLIARPKTAMNFSTNVGKTKTVESLVFGAQSMGHNIKADNNLISLTDQLLLLNNKTILPIQKNKNPHLNNNYSPRKNMSNNKKNNGWQPKLFFTPMKGSPIDDVMDLDGEECYFLKPITVEGENIKIKLH